MYKRWRVYSTFFTGLFIGLCFTLMLSAPIASVSASGEAIAQADWMIWRVLVLIMSGILGGTIYPIVTDGYVEMPRFVVNRGGLFKAGLFGDILLGIAGAAILELLLPSEWATLTAENADVSGIAIAATGITGGYGGRAILRFALDRVVKDTRVINEETDQWAASRKSDTSPSSDLPGVDWPTLTPSMPAESALETLPRQPLSEADATLVEGLMDTLSNYIMAEGSAPQLRSLKQQLQTLPAHLKPFLFAFLVEQRHLLTTNAKQLFSNKEKTSSSIQTLAAAQQPLPQPLQRLLTIFETLAENGWTPHPCYSQIALLYASGNATPTPTNSAKAIAYLDRAIASRGPLSLSPSSLSLPKTHPNPWLYELHRATLRINQEAFSAISDSSTSNNPILNTHQSEIIADLLSISAVYNLKTILALPEAQPYGAITASWMQQNQAILASHPNTRAWTVGTLQTPSPAPPSVPENPHNYRLSNCDLLLGQGFNLLTLDPFNLSGSAKSRTIFRFYDGEAIEIQDETRKLHPKGSRYRSVSKGGLSSTSHTSILYTEADAQRFLASNLGGLAAKLLGKILPCSLSGSYIKLRSERSLKKQIFSVTQAEYIDYLLDLTWEKPQDLHLDPLFRQAVAQLPIKGERAVGKEILPYLDFIENFGSHLAVQVQLGGLVHQKISLSESVYRQVVNKGAKLEAEAKKVFTARVNSASESSRYEEIREHSEQLQFCGGMMNSETVYEWFGTIKDDPAPVKVLLRSLHEVLSPAFFPTDPKITQKQALLADVTQHYLESTSEPPTWELWRSAAVGGNGGQSFTGIELSTVSEEINQARYESARVKAVTAWIGSSWVKGVESVLGKAETARAETVLLEEPAANGEVKKVLQLGESDYITAVRVMPAKAGLLRDRATYVGFVEITTHQGHQLIVGQPDERAIALDIPKGYQVISFHGRKGKYLDQLGVISAPLPEASRTASLQPESLR